MNPALRLVNNLNQSYLPGNEKKHEIFVLTGIDRFSKYPTADVFDNANASNIINFFRKLYTISRSISFFKNRSGLLSYQQPIENFSLKRRYKINPSCSR